MSLIWKFQWPASCGTKKVEKVFLTEKSSFNDCIADVGKSEDEFNSSQIEVFKNF